MQELNLWYLNHYIKSPDDIKNGRPYYLIKELLKHSIKPVVIGASYNHFSNPSYQQIESISEQYLDGIKYIRVKTPTYSSNGIKRILNMFSYSFSLLKFRNLNKNSLVRPDVIIASSVHPFHVFSALYLALKFKSQLIFEVRDIWPLSLSQILSVSKFHPFYIFTKFTELFAYKFSDKVISVLPNAYEYLKKYGVKEEKYKTITNGASIEGLNYKESDASRALAEYKNANKFLLVYTGSHGVPNCLDVIIDAAIMMQKHKDIKFIFVGDGSEKARLVTKQKEYSLSNIVFFNKVAREHIPKILSYADACVISWRDLDLYKYGVSPNKLYEYMLAGKPIIELINKSAATVETAKCGFRVEPENVENLIGTIEHIYQMSGDDLEQLGNNGREYLEENFSYQNLGLKFAKFIRS